MVRVPKCYICHELCDWKEKIESEDADEIIKRHSTTCPIHGLITTKLIIQKKDKKEDESRRD